MKARKLITTGEVARLLGVTPDTVRRQVRAGKLRVIREGGWSRFERGDVHLVSRIGPPLMTISQAARALGRSSSTVAAWANSGFIRFRKGRGGWRWFDRRDVLRLRRALRGRRLDRGRRPIGPRNKRGDS